MFLCNIKIKVNDLRSENFLRPEHEITESSLQKKLVILVGYIIIYIILNGSVTSANEFDILLSKLIRFR